MLSEFWTTHSATECGWKWLWMEAKKWIISTIDSIALSFRVRHILFQFASDSLIATCDFAEQKPLKWPTKKTKRECEAMQGKSTQRNRSFFFLYNFMRNCDGVYVYQFPFGTRFLPGANGWFAHGRLKRMNSRNGNAGVGVGVGVALRYEHIFSVPKYTFRMAFKVN